MDATYKHEWFRGLEHLILRLTQICRCAGRERTSNIIPISKDRRYVCIYLYIYIYIYIYIYDVKLALNEYGSSKVNGEERKWKF